MRKRVQQLLIDLTCVFESRDFHAFIIPLYHLTSFSFEMKEANAACCLIIDLHLKQQQQQQQKKEECNCRDTLIIVQLCQHCHLEVN